MFILIFIYNNFLKILSFILTASTIYFGLNNMYQRRVNVKISKFVDYIYCIENIGKKDIYDITIKLPDNDIIGNKPGIYPERKPDHYVVIPEYDFLENKPVDIDFRQHCNLLIYESKIIKLKYNSENNKILPEYLTISYIEKSIILRRKIRKSQDILINSIYKT